MCGPSVPGDYGSGRYGVSLGISRRSVARHSLLILNVKRSIDSIETIDGIGPFSPVTRVAEHGFLGGRKPRTPPPDYTVAPREAAMSRSPPRGSWARAAYSPFAWDHMRLLRSLERGRLDVPRCASGAARSAFWHPTAAGSQLMTTTDMDLRSAQELVWWMR